MQSLDRGAGMVERLKKILNSEKAMTIVNFLFLLSLIISNQGIIFIACIVWIAYLFYSMKRTSSKGLKVINGLFIVFAGVMIAVNLYFMLRY